jgi:hypothetical protein
MKVMEMVNAWFFQGKVTVLHKTENNSLEDDKMPREADVETK